MNRRTFFGKAFAAIVGASFLSLDDSDGLYPFQIEAMEYVRNGSFTMTDYAGIGKVYAPYVPLYMTSLV